MATYSPEVNQPPIAARTTVDAVERKEVPAVKLWAIPGFLMMAYVTYSLVAWVTGPNFERVPSGADQPTDAIKIASTVVTYGGFPAAAYVMYRWLFKPWRAERRVTSEGLLLLWFGTFAWFLDPFANFFNAFFTYNSWLPNMGSWVADTPGWASITAGEPGAMQAYPLLFVVTAYIWGLFGVCLFVCTMMKKLRARYPQMSMAMFMVNSFIISCVTFFILEAVYMRCGIYGYHGTIESLTLWYGHYYQMPLYEIAYAGAWTLAYASLLYFRNDKGQTIVERGTEKLRVAKPGQTLLRFAAMTAICTGIYMVTYNIPYWITNNVNEKWPAHAQNTTYLNNGICGEGTTTACPSPDLPIIKRDSFRFSRDGRVIDKNGNVVGTVAIANASAAK